MKTANIKNTLHILHKPAALLLTLVMVTGLLPAQAGAVDKKLPDWHFLVAIFKQVDASYEQDGVTKYEKNTLTQAEIDLVKMRANQFEEYMNSLGVMNAHVETIELSIPVTSLTPYTKGPWVSRDDAFPVLAKAGVDVTQYDHVTGMAKFDSYVTQYTGRTKRGTGIGTGYSFHNITHYNKHTDSEDWWSTGLFAHEFIHTMENISGVWGITFDEHKIQESYVPVTDRWKTCCTDILLHCAKGDGGTGIPRFVWAYPPTVLQNIEALPVPDGALAIGDFAFRDRKNLKSVTVPASVKTIGKSAFKNCANLETVTLSEGLSSIGEQAFRDCPRLVTSLPDSVQTIGSSAFQNSAVTDITIPSGVTAVNDWTFTDCAHLTSVTVPASVKTIGKSAFKNCQNLETVILSEGLLSVSEQAFRNCPKLVTNLPDSVQNIGSSAFQNSAVTEIIIPDSVTAVNDWTFMDCAHLTSVTVPSSVQTIGKCAFRNCPNLETVTLSEGLLSVGEQAFRNCPKLVTNLPDSVQNIGLSAFQNSAVTEITIPDGVTAVNDWTFMDCAHLTRVTVPASVQTIGKCAFRNCPNLETVILSEGLLSVGEKAFRKAGVQDVYYSGTETQWNAIQIDADNEPLKKAAMHFQASLLTGFQDVFSDAYYTAAVRWAVQKGITNGTGTTKFSPDQTCTQAQILTFLWRAAGSPEPVGNVDTGNITSDLYYHDAVQWAYENKISSEQEFRADAYCTRAMAVNYMWRYAGKPSSDTVLSFTDVNTDHAPAVKWALDHNVTNGTGKTSFSPDAVCTRAQIVTFLHRAFA